MPGNQSKNMPISPPLDRLRTGISRVRWCDPDNGRYTYQPAVMKEVMYSKEADSATEMSWFDELFHGGIVLPRQKGNRSRAVTLLITGPPGTGKSTLALELCVRLAMRGSQKPIEGKTLYVAYEAHPEWMIDNARSFGWLGQARKEVPNGDGSMRKEEDGEVVARLFNLGTKPSGAPISIRTPEEIEAGIGGFYRDLQALLGVTAPRAPLSEKEKDASSFDIVVIDSLNTVERGKEKKFAEHYKRFVEAGPKLIVFVLDSSPIIPVAETWEFAADIVVRLDRKYDSEYMIRTLEIVKARYQAHVWGKQQLKIEVAPETMPDKQVGASTENARIAAHTLNGLSEAEREERVRAHPWGEGGIFIFPSIHYILSRYKRRAPLELSKSNEGASTSSGRKPVPTPIESLNELLGGGIPAGRTTALWGERGTHKSHLGHMQVLHNVLDTKGSSIIISLRDDEAMTKGALEKIIEQHWPEHAGSATEKLNSMLETGRLEILYYPPGYITPEEFFHRMLLSIYRMRAANELLKGQEASKASGEAGDNKSPKDQVQRGPSDSYGITLLFNSLDQIASRFPLCAKEGVFIPGIIQTLASMGVTNIFVGAESEANDKGLRDLLSMAELILKVERKKRRMKEIVLKAASQRNAAFKGGDLEAAIDSLPEVFTITELTVERYAGGKPAGSQGMLELVAEKSLTELVLKRGLQFIPY